MGANTSRPSKVVPTTGSWKSGFVSDTARVGTADHGHRRCEQSVVGPDQDRLTITDLDRHRAPIGTDAGVDDREEHSRAEVLDAAGQQ